MFGFDFMNSVFPVIFTVMFVGIFIMFIVTAVRGIGRWHKNNNSPRLTVDATIVSKRMDVTHHHNSTTHTNSSSTWYYATFQVASGDRMELSIPTQDYGYLVEGDHGKLTFQGTRHLSFDRAYSQPSPPSPSRRRDFCALMPSPMQGSLDAHLSLLKNYLLFFDKK